MSEYVKEKVSSAIDILNASADHEGTIIALAIDRDSWKKIAESQKEKIERLEKLVFHFTGKME